MVMLSEIPAPFVSSPQTVEEQWIDFNGHLNMAYYGVLFDRTADDPFADFGMGPEYLKRTNCSTFMLEAKYHYLRELHVGDEVVATLQVLDVSDKCLHYVQELHHAQKGWLSAVMEAAGHSRRHGNAKAGTISRRNSEVFARGSRCPSRLPTPRHVGSRIESAVSDCATEI
ncbi:MAG: thioesterase family protein [Planctomycetaceae bacterium]